MTEVKDIWPPPPDVKVANLTKQPSASIKATLLGVVAVCLAAPSPLLLGAMDICQFGLHMNVSILRDFLLDRRLVWGGMVWVAPLLGLILGISARSSWFGRGAISFALINYGLVIAYLFLDSL